MVVYDGRQWHQDWLDTWCGPDACRIAVERAFVLGAVTGAYFVPPRDWRRVWNYVSEIGPREVARKIVSRRQESVRNEKFLSLVQGTVVQGPATGGNLAVGTHVFALCTLHPYAERTRRGGRAIGAAGHDADGHLPAQSATGIAFVAAPRPRGWEPVRADAGWRRGERRIPADPPLVEAAFARGERAALQCIRGRGRHGRAGNRGT